MGDRVSIAGRVDDDTLEAFDEWVAGHEEYGNRSAAIEGLIETVVGEEPIEADGRREEHTPRDELLSAVYEAALDHVGHDHVLPEEMVKSVAKTVNNDNSHDLSPDADAIRQFLFRLQNEGFAYQTFWEGSARFSKSVTRWHIKPLEANPEMWKYNPENVKERQKEQERRRTARLLGRDTGGEAGAD